MLFYVERYYRTAQTGSATKHARCERCGGEYSYEVVRRAMGEGHSPFMLRNTAAKAESQRQAGKKLAARLARAIDPVPCPGCGWFQSNMVREMRRRVHRWMLWTGWVLGGLFWISALLGFITATQGMTKTIEHQQGLLVSGLAGIGFALAGVFLVARHLLVSMIDLNRNWTPGTRPVSGAAGALPQQTPVAASAGPATNVGGFSPFEPDGWVTIQLAKVRYPARCCSCMAHTQRVHTYSCGKLATVTVPLCDECDRRYLRKHWLAQFEAAVLVPAALVAGAFAAPSCEPMLCVALVIGGLLVGAMLGVPIANRIARPAVFTGFRSEFNTLRVRFRNAEYLRALMENGQVA